MVREQCFTTVLLYHMSLKVIQTRLQFPCLTLVILVTFNYVGFPGFTVVGGTLIHHQVWGETTGVINYSQQTEGLFKAE